MKQNNKLALGFQLKEIDMKQLRDKQPLCYLLPNSHLVNALPFIDTQLEQSIPKSRVAYLIHTEQQEMKKDPQEYIAALALPQLSVANSPQFQKEVDRVNAKMSTGEKGQSKKKKGGLIELPKKLVAGEEGTVSSQVDSNIVSFNNSVIKSINLELCKKFGPLVLRELVDVLQRERSELANKIQEERQALSTLNQNRKYLQTESYQRENDIEERIRIMLNKRKKVQ